jgi:hypothetical protein
MFTLALYASVLGLAATVYKDPFVTSMAAGFLAIDAFIIAHLNRSQDIFSSRPCSSSCTSNLHARAQLALREENQFLARFSHGTMPRACAQHMLSGRLRAVGYADGCGWGRPELRTPLHGIIAASEALLEPGVDRRSAREGAEIIMSSAEHMLALVTNILDVERMQHEPLHLATIPFQPAVELKTRI